MQIQASLVYEPIRRIGCGQGQNSEVFLVDEPQLGGRLAVKEISKAKLSASGIADFFNEAKAMFASAHPNVVPIRYACERPDKICLVMPFYSKGSLQALLDQRPLTPIEALRLADGILAGVGQLHMRNYVHFDIKPTNIFFDDDGTPLVADFGQTRLMLHLGFAQAPALYEPVTPPEAILHGFGLPASDIYQVGLLLWRALSGERRYEQARDRHPDLSAAIAAGKFPPRKEFLPHIPKRLITLIRKAMEVDPAHRFHSASEFRDQLARVNVPLDWSFAEQPGLLEWSAARRAQPTLIVRMRQMGATWGTEAWTANSGTERRSQRAKFWRLGLKTPDALKQVASVLRELEL